MLGRVQLGEIEAQQVEAIVVPEGLGVSLLGQSFLSKIDRVEVAGGKMTLGG
jgi:aspartyl protease family protein